jgi:hypothetical protein
MPERTFALLVPRVVTNAPGCSHPLATQYIRDAARRVCERTLAWRYQVPLFNLMPGVPEYPFNKPASTDVHAVFSASVNDSPLDVLTLEQAIHAYPKWADQYNGLSASELWAGTPPSGTFNGGPLNNGVFNSGSPPTLPAAATEGGSDPRSITQVTPDKFVLLPMPDAAKTYRVRMFVALKPKRTATGMDEAALDDLEDVIVHGALQHLLVLPNVGWADKELASYHAKQYLSQVTERRARANLTNARGQMRVQYQPI